MENDRTLIVIPTYNERENIGSLIKALFAIAPDADVLLVDDQSSDGTIPAAEELFGTDPRFSNLTRTGRRSYGHSLLDGYRLAIERGYSRVVQLDADFSHDPKMVPAMISASRDADVVIGSRYCSGGRVANWPWQRRLLSRFANQYVSKITRLGVRDSTSGFRCYRRRAMQQLLDIGIDSEGYAFLVESAFRARLAGLRIVEVPITFTDRRVGQSKMSTNVIFESVLTPWRLRFGR